MVIIVSGFDLQSDVLRQLFNLFSFYGILKRIKVMYKKAGTVILKCENHNLLVRIPFAAAFRPLIYDRQSANALLPQALVQFQNVEGPRLAIENLNGQPWKAGVLKVHAHLYACTRCRGNTALPLTARSRSLPVAGGPVAVPNNHRTGATTWG